MSGEGDEPQAIRKLTPGKLVIASHNAGKVREIAALLEGRGLDVVSAASLDLPEPEETGTTFVMNAELKARAGERVDLVCVHAEDGVERVAEDFRLVPFDMPRGALAGYYPELNVLVPLSTFGEGSDTPTSKSVMVRLRAPVAA